MRQFFMFTFLTVTIHSVCAEDNSHSPAYFGAVSMVVTIMLVLLCVWLLNAHNLNRKVKLCILGCGIGIFGLAQMALSFGFDSYKRSLPPPNDPVVEFAVESVNERLPLQIADGVVMKSLELKDSAIVNTVEIDETKYPFEDFLQNKDLKKRLMMANMANSSPFESCSYVGLADKGYSAKTVIKGIQSHREIVYVATPEEIKRAQKVSYTPRDQLDLYLNSIKRNLPNKLDDGLTFSDAKIEEARFLFICTIDETIYDMKEVAKNKNEFKVKVEKDLKTEGGLIRLASLLVPLNMSFRVSYVGSLSKETVNVDISPSYLKKVVSDNQLFNRFK